MFKVDSTGVTDILLSRLGFPKKTNGNESVSASNIGIVIHMFLCDVSNAAKLE